MISEIDERSRSKTPKPSNPLRDRLNTADDYLAFIDVNCITAKWPLPSGQHNVMENYNTLTAITIAVDHGQLIAVVGHVGAGKVNVALI